MTREEAETTVNYNETDAPATVETANAALMRRLLRFAQERPDEVRVVLVSTESGNAYARFEVPKKWIKINPPRQVSEQQRAAMSERAKEYQKQKHVNQNQA